jgi:hypothetical protein
MGRFWPGPAFRKGRFSEFTTGTQSQEIADGVPIALDCGEMVNQLPALDAAQAAPGMGDQSQMGDAA